MARKGKNLNLSDEKEQELIELVRQKEYLYNKKHADFKDTIKKQNAWEDIAHQFGKEAYDCQATWESIKKQYTDYLRRIKHKTGSGNKGQGHIFRHSEVLAFYKDFYKPYKSQSNIDDEEDEDQESNDDFNDSNSTSINIQSEDGSNIEVEYSGFNDDDIPQFVTQKKAKTSEASGTSIDLKTRKRKQTVQQSEPSELDKHLLMELKALGSEKQDDIDFYLASLAPQLRNIYKQNPRKAGQLKIKIQTLLFEAEFDETIQ